VELGNGARAVLGPATRLDVAVGDASTGTIVTVRGEALFTIEHSSWSPFTVRTRESVTRVLGTTFFVRRYDSDRNTRVVVTDGRVAVQGNRMRPHARLSTTLAAGDLGVVDDSGLVQVTPDVSADEYTGWASGTLVFRKTPLNAVAEELSRAYGVTIRLADTTLSSYALTWTVQPQRNSLDEVLNELGMLVDVHIVRAHSAITIERGRPASAHPTLRQHPFTSESHYGR